MTSSGVPVGDTTLLQRLAAAEDRGDWTPQRLLYLAQADEMMWVCDALNALPAVVTLIEAAQQFIDTMGRGRSFVLDKDNVPKGFTSASSDAAIALDAALASFVGEATQ